MSYFSQSGYQVRLEWGIAAIDNLAHDADCILIVDVMSFSTCVSIAADRGAMLFPYPWKDATPPENLHQCASARELTERGFATDVTLCLEADVSDLACQLIDDAFIGISNGKTRLTSGP